MMAWISPLTISRLTPLTARSLPKSLMMLSVLRNIPALPYWNDGILEHWNVG
jgi:hypothetical protein